MMKLKYDLFSPSYRCKCILLHLFLDLVAIHYLFDKYCHNSKQADSGCFIKIIDELGIQGYTPLQLFRYTSIIFL